MGENCNPIVGKGTLVTRLWLVLVLMAWKMKVVNQHLPNKKGPVTKVPIYAFMLSSSSLSTSFSKCKRQSVSSFHVLLISIWSLLLHHIESSQFPGAKLWVKIQDGSSMAYLMNLFTCISRFRALDRLPPNVSIYQLLEIRPHFPELEKMGFHSLEFRWHTHSFLTLREWIEKSEITQESSKWATHCFCRGGAQQRLHGTETTEGWSFVRVCQWEGWVYNESVDSLARCLMNRCRMYGIHTLVLTSL